MIYHMQCIVGYTRGGPCQHGFMCGCRQWSNPINESNYNMQPITIIQFAVIIIIIIIIMAGMAVFNVAGYLIEERRRWPVITASPRGQCSK